MLAKWDDDKLNNPNAFPLFKKFITRESEFIQKSLSHSTQLEGDNEKFSIKDKGIEGRLKIIQKVAPFEKDESEKVLWMVTYCYLHHPESIDILECMHEILNNNKDFVLDEDICEIMRNKLMSIETQLVEKLKVLKIWLIQISRKMSNELENAILEALRVGNLSFEADICDPIDEIKTQKSKYRIYELLLIHNSWRDLTFLSKWLSEVSSLFNDLEPKVENLLISALANIYKSYIDQTPGCLAKALLEKLINKASDSKEIQSLLIKLSRNNSSLKKMMSKKKSKVRLNNDVLKQEKTLPNSKSIKDKGKKENELCHQQIKKLLKRQYSSLSEQDKAIFLSLVKESERKNQKELKLCKQILSGQKRYKELAENGIEIALSVLDKKLDVDIEEEYEEADYVLAEKLLLTAWKCSQNIQKNHFDRINDLAANFSTRRTLLLALNRAVSKTENINLDSLIPVFKIIDFSNFDKINNEDIIAEIMINALEVWTGIDKKSKNLYRQKCDLILQIKATECLLKQELDQELISKRIDYLKKLFTDEKKLINFVPPLLIKLLLKVIKIFTMTKISSKWMELLIQIWNHNTELYRVFGEEEKHFKSNIDYLTFTIGLSYFTQMVDKEHLKLYAIDFIKNALKGGVVVSDETLSDILKIPDDEFIINISTDLEQPNHHFYYQIHQFWNDISITFDKKLLKTIVKDRTKNKKDSFSVNIFGKLKRFFKGSGARKKATDSPTLERGFEEEKPSENFNLARLYEDQKDEFFKHISPIWIIFLKECLNDEEIKPKIFNYMHTCQDLFANFEFKVKCEGYLDFLKEYFTQIEPNNAFENIKSFIFARIEHEELSQLIQFWIEKMLESEDSQIVLKALELIQIDLIGERKFNDVIKKVKLLNLKDKYYSHSIGICNIHKWSLIANTIKIKVF
jgi:hypothetical protein